MQFSSYDFGLAQVLEEFIFQLVQLKNITEELKVNNSIFSFQEQIGSVGPVEQHINLVSPNRTKQKKNIQKVNRTIKKKNKIISFITHHTINNTLFK